MILDEGKSLKATPLFKDFPEKILQAICLASPCIEAEKNDVIYKAHERADSIYLLIKGEAKLTKKDQNTKIIKAPNLLGKFAFLSQDSYKETLCAKTKSTYIQIKHALYKKIITEDPELAYNNILYLARYIMDLSYKK